MIELFVAICVIDITFDPFLSDSLYDDMIQHSTDDQWYCSQYCVVCSGNFNRSLQLSPTIKCAIISECSIVGKKFDLCGYVAVHQLDLLAVTETS